MKSIKRFHFYMKISFNMQTFQYFSDLHVDFLTDLHILDNLQPSAPYLIIAGDIGSPFNKLYTEFLSHVSRLFTQVFIISGNHEYYYTRDADYKSHDADYKTRNSTEWMMHIDNHIRHLCESLPNVVYLQNQVYELPNTDICIYGTTLWSHIYSAMKYEVKRGVSDYRRIPYFTTEYSNQLFDTNQTLLEEAINKHTSKRFVVVSHHLPSRELIHDKYKYCEVNSAFASDVHIASDSRIIAWIAGHTHIPMECGKYHINPIGYPNENSKIDFNCTLTC